MPSLRSPSFSPRRPSPYSSSESHSDHRRKRRTDVTQGHRVRCSPSPHKRRKRHDDNHGKNTNSYQQSSRRYEDGRTYGRERDASPSKSNIGRTSNLQRYRSYDHNHTSSKDRRDHENRNRRYRDRSESPRDRHRISHCQERTYELDRDRSPNRRRRRSLGKLRSQSPSSRSESQSPSRSHSYSHSHSQSQSRSHRRKKHELSPSQPAPPPPRPAVRSGRPLPSQAESYKGTNDVVETTKPDIKEKEKPNYNITGLLARETNAVSGTDIVLKYNEPSDARKPPSSWDWRLYIFKHSSLLQTITLRTRTCWLIGRELAVADIPVEHPSCSKQHAVIQFRHRATVNEFGDKDAKVRPYLIDLESSNGTLLNGEKIEASRYFEVRNGDVVKFGFSEREFVVMLPPKDI